MSKTKKLERQGKRFPKRNEQRNRAIEIVRVNKAPPVHFPIGYVDLIDGRGVAERSVAVVVQDRRTPGIDVKRFSSSPFTVRTSKIERLFFGGCKPTYLTSSNICTDIHKSCQRSNMRQSKNRCLQGKYICQMGWFTPTACSFSAAPIHSAL